MNTLNAVIILAAGLGRRMKSQKPKVLHEIGGKPLLFHILKSVSQATPQSPIAIVVGHGREQVEASIRAEPLLAKLNLSFIHQPEQNGTGHAARCAMDSEWGAKVAAQKLPVLVLPGDLPLIPSSLIEAMSGPIGTQTAVRVLTCELDEPTGYGRIVRRGKKGSVLRIVEEKDANFREKQIQEVATSIYLFSASFLKASLPKLSNKNAQSEYYLTDLVSRASRMRRGIDVLSWKNCEDLRGINDPWELAQAGRTLNERVISQHARRGVKFIDPWTTQVDVSVVLEEGATIHPGVILAGQTTIQAGAVIGPHCVLKDMLVAKNAQVKVGTTGESSQILEGAQVGPYAHLRPESIVGGSAKIGNFVELKKTRIGARSSVAHLSYLGDAEVGERVNIGCGFVTCNFDGRVIAGSRKHRTLIEDDAFIGSDCQAIAPITIGRGAYVASGSTITDDVEAGALAIARARQVQKAGYARKLRTDGSK